MPGNTTLWYRVRHPLKRREDAEVERYLKIESIRNNDVIERERKLWEEKQREIKQEHYKKLGDGVEAPGLLESRQAAGAVGVLAGHCRRNVSASGENWLSNAGYCSRPSGWISSKLRWCGRSIFGRMAADDEYKRRVAAMGVPGHRSLYRDDAEYGSVVALIRRRIQELKLNPPKQKWTRDDTWESWW